MLWIKTFFVRLDRPNSRKRLGADIRRRRRRDRQSSGLSFHGGPCVGHRASIFRFVALLHLDWQGSNKGDTFME